MNDSFEQYVPERFQSALKNAEAMNKKIQDIYSDLCDPEDPTLANRPIYTKNSIFYGESSYRYSEEGIKKLQNQIAQDLIKIQKVEKLLRKIAPMVEAAVEKTLEIHRLSLGIYYETNLLSIVMRPIGKSNRSTYDFSLTEREFLGTPPDELKKEIISTIYELL